MKTKLNVLKKEAEQICLWGEAIYNEQNYLMICDDGQMVFDIYGGSDDTKLSYENEYKDYEWRLTDIKDLQQGDIIKCIYQSNNFTEIGVFDEYVIFWAIESNRPKKQIISTNKSLELIYKLFKKEMK